jgi:hypothetical protein
MDRIVEVKVGGNYIRKDKKTAGVRGEYEVAILRIEFDKSWDEYEKRITFWDARGERPVYRELDATRLENHTQSERVFLVPIPEEPMAVAGDMTFVIDGIVDGKKQRSMSDKLEVKDAPIPDDAKEPTEPTPSDVEQMRLELGRIKDSILEAVDAKEDILNMTVSSETLTPDEVAFVIRSDHDGVPHLLFGIPKGDTGDSGVYIGDEAPSDPEKNVWINPSASKLILMIRNEQGEWVEIPAITGKSAYEIAIDYGFIGTEAEWNDAVNLNRIAAENAFAEADKARIAAEKSNLTAGNNAVLARDYKRQAQEYALAAGESATSAHDFAVQAEEQKGFAQEYANASGEYVADAHNWAEEAKKNADKAEQYANEMSGVLPNIEAGLSLRPTTQQVKAMHEEDMAVNYNNRKIPEGKTIDDLYLEEDYGLYMIDDEVPSVDKGFTSRGSQLIVTGGYYWLEGFGDKTTTCQVLLCHDGFKYGIKQRSLQNGKWSDWEDRFATKDEVSKVTYFKKVPNGKSIDELYGEEHLGWYIGKVKSNFNNEYNPDEDFHFLFVNDGWTITDKGDIADYFQTRFVWDGFNYKIQTRKGSGGTWSDWENAFGGSGGGGENWELLQSHEVTEEDGELENLVVTFPEGYKEYVVRIERTAPTASSNTTIYPYVINGIGSLTVMYGSFWDYYDGTKASHCEIRFSTIKTQEKTVVKMEGYGYSSNQKPIGKPQALFTSGWVDKDAQGYTIQKWGRVDFKTKLNVGSKYTVWGCKQ